MEYPLIHRYDDNTAIIGIKPRPSGWGMPMPPSPSYTTYRNWTYELGMREKNDSTMYGFKHVLWYDLLEEKFLLFQNHKKTIEAFANHNVVISPHSVGTHTRIPKTMLGPYVSVDENTKVFCKLVGENA
jgi:hypothetical protein